MSQDMREALSVALIWLRAALDCKAFTWDEDQREAAEQSLEDANKALAALSRPSPDARTEGLVERLRGLLAKATNVGQWRIGRLGIEPRPHVVDFGPPPSSPFFVLSKATPSAPGFTGLSAGGSVHSDDGDSEANAALIVAAVNALPDLLTVIEQQAARIVELEAVK